jgi:hypothetical protein
MTSKAIPRHPAALYFNELLPGRGQQCVLFGHFHHPPVEDARLTRAVLAQADGAWNVLDRSDVNDIIAGAAICEIGGVRHMLAVYRNGESYLYRGAERTEIAAAENVGFLAGAQCIGAHVYACGSQNVVLRFDGGSWTDIADGIRTAYSSARDPILNDIAGFDEGNLYSVGYGGSILHFDGSRWNPLDTPTNRNLHRVLCHADRVYACGQGGVVMRGIGSEWELLHEPGMEEDIWGLSTFRGSVFCSTYRNLYRITGNSLEEIPVPVNSSGTFYRLASNGEFMWATTGTGAVLRFDGRTWIELVWPDSVLD